MSSPSLSQAHNKARMFLALGAILFLGGIALTFFVGRWEHKEHAKALEAYLHHGGDRPGYSFYWVLGLPVVFLGGRLAIRSADTLDKIDTVARILDIPDDELRRASASSLGILTKQKLRELAGALQEKEARARNVDVPLELRMLTEPEKVRDDFKRLHQYSVEFGIIADTGQAEFFRN